MMPNRPHRVRERLAAAARRNNTGLAVAVDHSTSPSRVGPSVAEKQAGPCTSAFLRTVDHVFVLRRTTKIAVRVRREARSSAARRPSRDPSARCGIFTLRTLPPRHKGLGIPGSGRCSITVANTVGSRFQDGCPPGWPSPARNGMSPTGRDLPMKPLLPCRPCPSLARPFGRDLRSWASRRGTQLRCKSTRGRLVVRSRGETTGCR